MKEQYVIKRILEDDFGCEGLPENAEPMITVVLEDSDGNTKRIRMSDSLAYERGLDEGDIVLIDTDGSLLKAE